MEDFDEKFYITQIGGQQTKFQTYINCVTTAFKWHTQDVYEKCCSSSEKNILIKGECNKWYNTEIKIAKRNMRHAEKKSRQDKMNELKHNEFRWLNQSKCELDTRTKALFYKKKLNESWNDSSKFFGQLNILLGENKNSNILPSGKSCHWLAIDFDNSVIDKINKIMRGFQNCHNSEDIYFRFQTSL